MEVLILLWFALSLVLAGVAKSRGRRSWAWFLLSLALSPLVAGVVLFVIPDLEEWERIEKQKAARKAAAENQAIDAALRLKGSDLYDGLEKLRQLRDAAMLSVIEHDDRKRALLGGLAGRRIDEAPEHFLSALVPLVQSGYLSAEEVAIVKRVVLAPTTIVPMAVALVVLSFVAVGLLGCRRVPAGDGPQVASKNSASVDAPAMIPDLAEVVVEVQGWRTLKWRDDPPTVDAKMRADGLVACRIGERGKSKGYQLDSYLCKSTPKEKSGLHSAAMMYLDGHLGRVILNYFDMTPDSAAIQNLDVALQSRYCGLSDSLSEAVRQERLGNEGGETQVRFRCKTHGGNLFVSVHNEAASSLVRIFITSDDYQKYLSKNEFAETL